METGQKNLLVFNIRRASAVSAAIRAVFPGSRAAPARRREIRRRSSQDYVTFCYRFSTTRGPLPHSLWKTRPAPVAPRRKRVTIITPRPRIPVQGRWPLTPRGLAARRTSTRREAPLWAVSGFGTLGGYAGAYVLAHVRRAASPLGVMRHYEVRISV